LERATEDKKLKTVYRSQQYGIKIVMNACGYGSNAPAEVRYGNFALAVLITGIGRYILELACNWIVDNLALAIIERDTDGVYLSGEISESDAKEGVERLNDYLEEDAKKWALQTRMKMPDGTERRVIEMEYTHHARSYFYRMKSYILDKKGDGDLKFMGAAFKSSGKPGIFDKVKVELAKMKLDEATREEVTGYIKKVMKIQTWDITDLAMRRTISRLPHQYKNKNDLGARLALLAKEHLNIEPRAYNQYEFVFMDSDVRIATGDYGLAEMATHDMLNYKRYRSMIVDLCKLFGYDGIAKPFFKHPGVTPVEGWF